MHTSCVIDLQIRCCTCMTERVKGTRVPWRSSRIRETGRERHRVAPEMEPLYKSTRNRDTEETGGKLIADLTPGESKSW